LIALSICQRFGAIYSSTGRPSIDPELLVRMLLVGYCFGIRSERRLCEEVHLNLAYRWFCRLDELHVGVPSQVRAARALDSRDGLTRARNIFPARYEFESNSGTIS
jgi:hypothetical protein